jgi:hypothetical protein
MKKLLYCCLVFLITPLFLRSQVANNTSLVGTVVDTAGLPVIDGQVVATEENTKVKTAAKTNAQGYYSMGFMNPGTYDISVETNGFKKEIKTGVILPVNIAVRTNFSLAIGSAQDTVTVSADTPPMATDDATLSETFNQQTVEDLPIASHNAMDVAAVSSNVYIGAKTSYQGNPPGEDIEGAGQREIQNSISFDGVSIMNISFQPHPIIRPRIWYLKFRYRVATTLRSTDRI